jgi:quinol monooxygenase YgiN
MSYLLIAQLRSADGNEDLVAQGLAVNQAASRQEPGVLEWTAYRSADDPRSFLLYECYTDQSGLEAHRAAPHFQRYLQEVVPLLEKREFAHWQPIDSD